MCWIAPGLLFMSVIHSERMFMCGVRGGLIFILLSVDIRWLQKCVERAILLPLNFLAPFSKINLTINSRVYLWINPTPLICPHLAHAVLATVALKSMLKPESVTLATSFF